MQGLDLENKDKRYLDEKELFILYWILKRKIISTGFSNLFTPNQKFTPVGPITDFNQIATIEEDISSSYENSIRRITHLLGSPTVPKYLLELGKAFDEKGFKVLGNADYSLVDGGFLSEIDEMVDILNSYFRRRTIRTLFAVILGFILGYSLIN